jgi:uncharacterized RDD family membrane protein YckC
MKCPKCDYLGFETGDRCKNCGYDFSLMTGQPPFSASDPDPAFDVTLRPAVAPEADVALPLFTLPRAVDDDEPLIKLPAAPRPPLAVRKTPDSPRLRAVQPRQAPRAAEPLLFSDEGALDPDLQLRPPSAPEPAPVTSRPRRPAVATAEHTGTSTAGARLAAAVIDHLILLVVDGTVVYFTLKMAALTPAEWTIVPLTPLLTFLVLLKFAYFFAFTAVGGQTIGKMALSIRVVTDDERAVDAACAVRRTLAGVLSAISFGLGFLPALLGADRRALHDRVAHTRVVALRSA